MMEKHRGDDPPLYSYVSLYNLPSLLFFHPRFLLLCLVYLDLPLTPVYIFHFLRYSLPRMFHLYEVFLCFVSPSSLSHISHLVSVHHFSCVSLYTLLYHLFLSTVHSYFHYISLLFSLLPFCLPMFSHVSLSAKSLICYPSFLSPSFCPLSPLSYL